MKPAFRKATLSKDVLDKAKGLLHAYQLEKAYLSDDETTGPCFIDGSLLVSVCFEDNDEYWFGKELDLKVKEESLFLLQERLKKPFFIIKMI